MTTSASSLGGPAFLVSGADPVLVGGRLRRLIDDLVGTDDRALAVDEYRLAAPEDSAVSTESSEAASEPGGRVRKGATGRLSGGAAVSGGVAGALRAARTPPFGTRQRIVVLRGIERLSAADLEAMVVYLTDPSPDSVMVLEVTGRPPERLVKAIRVAGGSVVEPDRGGRVSEAAPGLAAELGLRLRPDAVRLLSERLGEDGTRLPALFDLLAATFGSGATIGATDLAPYVGQEGRVPPYVLTGAIDRGEARSGVEALERLLGPGGMHPLQVMALLHGHFRRLLRLDDPTVTTEAEAVAALGGKVKPYPAGLALRQAGLLGVDRMRAAYRLLVEADLGLRGASGCSPETVLEVLVVRLAELSKQSRLSKQGRLSG